MEIEKRGKGDREKRECRIKKKKKKRGISAFCLKNVWKIAKHIRVSVSVGRVYLLHASNFIFALSPK